MKIRRRTNRPVGKKIVVVMFSLCAAIVTGVFGAVFRDGGWAGVGQFLLFIPLLVVVILIGLWISN